MCLSFNPEPEKDERSPRRARVRAPVQHVVSRNPAGVPFRPNDVIGRATNSARFQAYEDPRWSQQSYQSGGRFVPLPPNLVAQARERNTKSGRNLRSSGESSRTPSQEDRRGRLDDLIHDADVREIRRRRRERAVGAAAAAWNRELPYHRPPTQQPWRPVMDRRPVPSETDTYSSEEDSWNERRRNAMSHSDSEDSWVSRRRVERYRGGNGSSNGRRITEWRIRSGNRKYPSHANPNFATNPNVRAHRNGR